MSKPRSVIRSYEMQYVFGEVTRSGVVLQGSQRSVST
ncbi:hypothetical protein FOQG_10599 [Fusarium oxysporum f. sp. raphani 54005]|uniref:Uncharacterized protein n=4 Tax=Fusarium oxysporum TaxID=5507 RepID=X0CSN9_FUSOX|nr:hypothetical protein FOVG_11520 [Fusarium oxysporum f. sp. pisi HDV247]EXK85527.1 hypothetical protein FOQG_10599 [Fusarium oxysporum f. sp. raphani 54005]EXL81430.1 hypothetical protein FOPG_05437 [Fusarium oxysporum f. sp. conglutinans race 2 54008]EXM21773.1 hypothetical protein FOTG_10382 [Fusarium oxysporum f. sp. vasinfectum 25433]